MTALDSPTDSAAAILAPTLGKQCVGFMIGSALFALGSAPGFAAWAGESAANVSYFIGAWFFTAAALIQLLRSGAVTVPVTYHPGTMVRAEWLSASTQFFGTLLFNVSTAAALTAHSVAGEKRFVWNPDAGGSVAFLISGALGILALYRVSRVRVALGDASWWSQQINFLGCVAFGVSAVGAFVTASGNTVDAGVANIGTFIGALCFFAASAVVLPSARADH